MWVQRWNTTTAEERQRPDNDTVEELINKVAKSVSKHPVWLSPLHRMTVPGRHAVCPHTSDVHTAGRGQAPYERPISHHEVMCVEDQRFKGTCRQCLKSFHHVARISLPVNLNQDLNRRKALETRVDVWIQNHTSATSSSKLTTYKPSGRVFAMWFRWFKMPDVPTQISTPRQYSSWLRACSYRDFSSSSAVHKENDGR